MCAILALPPASTLYCTVLCCAVLYCTVLYCTVLYCRWTNLALYTAKQLYDKSWLRRNNFSREVVRTADGGTVSIDYAVCELPPAAPLVIFLHTITGSGREVGHYMRAATARGWRSCVFNRKRYLVPRTVRRCCRLY